MKSRVCLLSTSNRKLLWRELILKTQEPKPVSPFAQILRSIMKATGMRTRNV